MKNRRGTFLLIWNRLEKWKSSAAISICHRVLWLGHPVGWLTKQLKPVRCHSGRPAALQSQTPGNGRTWLPPCHTEGFSGHGWVTAPAPCWGRWEAWIRCALMWFKTTPNAQGWTTGLINFRFLWFQRGVRVFGDWNLEQSWGKTKAPLQSCSSQGKAESPMCHVQAWRPGRIREGPEWDHVCSLSLCRVTEDRAPLRRAGYVGTAVIPASSRTGAAQPLFSAAF